MVQRYHKELEKLFDSVKREAMGEEKLNKK
jgi:hypothetical protein